MPTYYNLRGEPISLGDVLGSGGQADVYAVVGKPDTAAKVYKDGKAPFNIDRKLRLMLDGPPDQGAAGHRHIAWPSDLLLNERGRVVGFLMPRVSSGDSGKIINFYHPARRPPGFNYRYLIQTAHNLAVAVESLHRQGYVIGDINESNVFVNDQALVTLVDADSFQVSDVGSKTVYLCPVGRPEYTPPELHGSDFRRTVRTSHHDGFGLAVLIFQLLMQGRHPYHARYAGDEPDEPQPELSLRVAAGNFPYTKRPGQAPYVPNELCRRLWDALHPQLRARFLSCFDQPIRDSVARPSASNWRGALDAAIHDLTQCEGNEQHWYFKHNGTCTWCELAQEQGTDRFPPFRSSSHDAQYYLNRGDDKLERDDYDGAIADYNQAILLNPNDRLVYFHSARAYYNRGSVRWEKGDRDGAIADYDEAIALRPNYATAYYNRGLAKRYKRDYDDAISDYDQAIALDPNYAAAYNNRGVAKEYKRDYDGAISDYDQAIALRPNYAAAYNNRGVAKEYKRDYDGAISDYDQAIALRPNYATAYYNRGLAKRYKRDYDGAISDYDQAIALDPNYATAYYNRGNTKRYKRDNDGAISDYDQAIALDPNYAAAYRSRGLLKEYKRDADGAVADYSRADALQRKYKGE